MRVQRKVRPATAAMAAKAGGCSGAFGFSLVEVMVAMVVLTRATLCLCS